MRFPAGDLILLIPEERKRAKESDDDDDELGVELVWRGSESEEKVSNEGQRTE